MASLWVLAGPFCSAIPTVPEVPAIAGIPTDTGVLNIIADKIKLSILPKKYKVTHIELLISKFWNDERDKLPDYCINYRLISSA
jgi:hypothetical protein